jgi:glycosyltransferase involved in cell wall biosynthesis
MLRICHLITDLDTGGAERSLVNLLTGMDRTQFSNEVVTLIEPGSMAQPLIAAGIPVMSLGMRRGRPSAAALWRLVRHVRATRPAILQTWLYHADLVGTAAAWIARSQYLAWNVRCTDMDRAGTERAIRRLVRVLAFLSGVPDAIVVNSRSGQRDHEAMGYRAKNWISIPNGVDLERFHPRRAEQAALRTRLGLRADVMTIGFVGRDHPMKDVDTFLRAAAHLLKTGAHAQFLLCGDGFDAGNEKVARLIANLGLNGRIALLGRRPDVELIYPALDILTLCSIYGEGFPNVLCEAMACGVPCVATDIGDSAEIIGDCGIIVPTGDPEALAQGWRTAVAQGIQTLGGCSRSRATERYGIERMREQYQAFYRSLAVTR